MNCFCCENELVEGFNYYEVNGYNLCRCCFDAMMKIGNITEFRIHKFVDVFGGRENE